MALSAGTRLGPYEIVAPLGAGGMGEVYRARDTKLGREVAIKVLPAAVAQDAERLSRFKREAMLLASLNHPNIGAIYGLEESPSTGSGQGLIFLVLELVPGEDLAERLKRGAVPVDEALNIAKQIAAALEEADEKGIVHRDLKPANVKLTATGKVKVLDFGLAKACASDASSPGAVDSGNSPTLTHAATMAGTILGTAAYMSPEQARGKALDKRSDIWSFGAVLYELLAGRPLFTGESVSDVVAAVLRDDVDWSALPAATPEPVRRLLARCLDRDVKTRLQAIGEARVTLEDVTARSSGVREPSRSGASRPLRWLVAGCLMVVAALALIVWQVAGSGHKKSAPPSSGERSIAVLPFVNSSGNADDEYLADGMTDELISGLGKVPGLHVAARSSAFSFKGQKTEVREVARKLGVDSVLEGALRRSGKRVRVTASLVNASDGLQIWSSAFENDGSDSFAVQDDVTRGVLSGLSLQLGGAAQAASQAGRTKDPVAHDLYLRGLASANASSEGDLRRALEYYEQAIARDPGYALAYVGIAWVHIYLADAYVPPEEANRKAIAAASAALERDDNLADAHAILAYSKMALWEDPAGVEREFARALELDPNSATTVLLHGFYKFLGGRFDEANRDLDRAEQLDPLSPIGPVMREIGAYSAGRFQAVIEAHKKTVAIDPTFVYFQSWVGAAYRELGDYPAALREFAIADKTLGGLPQHGLALTYIRLGRVDDARDIMRRMDERAKTHYVPFFTRAGLHAALGDMDTAVSLLQQSVDHRESVMVMIRSVSELAPLLKDPRAKRILDQVDVIRSGK